MHVITRRDFGKGATAMTLTLTAGPAVAQASSPLMRFGNAAGITDSQLAFITAGRHPKLGFYKVEGIDTDTVNMSSTSQTLGAIAQGQVEYASLAVGSYLPLIAKNPALDVISAYVFLPQNHLLVGVKPDSPFKAIGDLKGRTIGIRNTGDTGYFGTRAMFRELGLDPAVDAQWLSVGTGGPAGAALYNGSIDAIAIWDAELARIELAGFKLRYLPNTAEAQKLSGVSFGIRRSELKANRRNYVGLFRGIAKSTIFAASNLEMAIRMHWQLYPESKPRGKSDEEALKDALYVLMARKDKWFAAPSRGDNRMGAGTLADWQGQVRYVGQQAPEVIDKIKDTSTLFTNELIDEVNNFDRTEIARLAETVSL
jgi:NitT/TauT family transport system substrate-binding protein